MEFAVTTISARPDALDAYANSAAHLDAAIETVGVRLVIALDAVDQSGSAGISNTRVHAHNVTNLAAAAAELDAWVRSVGDAFRSADAGLVCRDPGRAPGSVASGAMVAPNPLGTWSTLVSSSGGALQVLEGGKPGVDAAGRYIVEVSRASGAYFRYAPGSANAMKSMFGSAADNASHIASYKSVARSFPLLSFGLAGAGQALGDAQNTKLDVGDRATRVGAAVALEGGGGALGGWGGATAGAAMGAIGGPPGIVVGAIAGGIIGAFGGSAAGGWFKNRLFESRFGGWFN